MSTDGPGVRHQPRAIAPRPPWLHPAITQESRTKGRGGCPSCGFVGPGPPWKGHIAIFDSSWYLSAVTKCLDDGKCKALTNDVIDEIVHLERLLSEDGVVMINKSLHTSQRKGKRCNQGRSRRRHVG
jgi:hypothetical protein